MPDQDRLNFAEPNPGKAIFGRDLACTHFTAAFTGSDLQDSQLLEDIRTLSQLVCSTEGGDWKLLLAYSLSRMVEKPVVFQQLQSVRLCLYISFTSPHYLTFSRIPQ